MVSVHDIAPFTRAPVEKILSQLQRHGVNVCSLLVVPDYHRQGASMEDRDFVRWLRDLEAAGHEVVIHGFFHERPRRGSERLREKFITRFYTSDEGEFYDLPYEEAFRRITRARDAFVAAGLTPRGFIAPAWLLGAEALRAATDAGMEYTTRLGSVHDLRSGEVFPAHSLVYSVRNKWRRTASLAWNRTLFRCTRNAPLLRLSIHPGDPSHPAIWEQILRLTDEMLRTATTYRDWLAEQRARRGGLLE